MSDQHVICRIMLRQAREEAKKVGVVIPKNMTALESFGQYFIEADGVRGEWIQRGDCTWSAKANYIDKLIDKKNEGEGAAQ